jgi:NitT/TauT family transport system substrate-binding protein
MTYALRFSFFFLLLSLCSSCATQEIPSPIKIGIANSRTSLPLIVAFKENFFLDENLCVELITFENGKTKDNAFQRNRTEGMISSLPQCLAMKQETPDLKVISAIRGGGRKEGRYAIVSKPFSSIHHLKDLKGKTIAVSTDSTSEFVTDQLFKNEGLSPTIVEKVCIYSLSNRLNNLLKGVYDAATFPEPLITFAKSNGCHVIADDTQKSLSYHVVAFHDTWLENNPSKARGFLRALNKAIKAINKNPKKYYQQLLEIASEPNSEPDSFRSVLLAIPTAPKNFNEDHVIPAFSYKKIPTREHFKQVSCWLKEKKFLHKNISYSDLITGKYLKEET